jgi:hypothetical protein
MLAALHQHAAVLEYLAPCSDLSLVNEVGTALFDSLLDCLTA